MKKHLACNQTALQQSLKEIPTASESSLIWSNHRKNQFLKINVNFRINYCKNIICDICSLGTRDALQHD